MPAKHGGVDTELLGCYPSSSCSPRPPGFPPESAYRCIYTACTAAGWVFVRSLCLYELAYGHSLQFQLSLNTKTFSAVAPVLPHRLPLGLISSENWHFHSCMENATRIQASIKCYLKRGDSGHIHTLYQGQVTAQEFRQEHLGRTETGFSGMFPLTYQYNFFSSERYSKFRCVETALRTKCSHYVILRGLGEGRWLLQDSCGLHPQSSLSTLSGEDGYLGRYQQSTNACLLLLPSVLGLPGTTSNCRYLQQRDRPDTRFHFSLKDHIPVLTSLFFFPEKLLACFLSLARELSNKHLVTFN